jgi:hypothetical protein
MWTVNVILPYGIRFTLTPHGLLVAGALLTVALLLWLYVMLLHHSVERGQSLRDEQRRMAMQSSAKAVHHAPFSRAAAAANP